MNLAPTKGAIAVATSIPPKIARRNAGHAIDDAYQRLCIRSWIDCGFRVVSINAAEEIGELAPRYPEVEFVATHRDAGAWTGRKNPYIADLLLALNDAPEPVLGIVNSDLVFETSSAWQARLPALVGDTVITGQRYDTTSLLDGTFRRYYFGFDCFFFDKSLARALAADAMPYAMGLPWWDYWFPCAASLHQRRIMVADRPGIVHLIHKSAYPEKAWRAFALIFSKFVIGACEPAPQAAAQSLAAILPLCRDIAASAGEVMRGGPWDRKISDIAAFIAPWIRKDIVPLSPIPSSPDICSDRARPDGSLNPANVFRRFDQRFAAGVALEQGRALQRENPAADARPEFLAALRDAPGDFDVLLTVGEYALDRGEIEKAYTLLRKAVAQCPESPPALDSLGLALRQMGKRDEAILHMEKILNADPGYAPAYINLAVLLCETKRPREALALLERALAQWPQFTRASELHRHIAADLARL